MAKFSKFYEMVWELTITIPKGKVTTYGEIARKLGIKSARPVGQALKSNPHAPAVPCHRVVKSNSFVGNYSRGISEKIKLLRSEGVPISEQKKIENLIKYLFRFD